MTIDAEAAVNPKPPIGAVMLDPLGYPAVILGHPGLYPSMVIAATEKDIREGRRALIPPAILTPAHPDQAWDVHVLQAFAAVAPAPHPQH